MTISRFSQSTLAKSKRSQQTTDALAGLIPLPYTPTIGTATDGGTGTTVSVAFTPNATVPSGTFYTALSSPGSITASGSASPITVSGLTSGTAYTFQVRASNATGNSAYSAASNSVTPVDPASYESIATATVGAGGSSSITFSSIPSTYKHLQIRGISKNTENASNSAYDTIIFNSDTATNYSVHGLYGSGATIISDAYTTRANMLYFGTPRSAAGVANMFSASIVDILDYANTSKYKTIKTFAGADVNNATGTYFGLYSGNWRSTAAVTSITISAATFSLAQYSSFALYGIKG